MDSWPVGETITILLVAESSPMVSTPPKTTDSHAFISVLFLFLIAASSRFVSSLTRQSCMLTKYRLSPTTSTFLEVLYKL